MEFIQIIDIHSSKVDELSKLEEEWRKATEGKRTLKRSILTRDRNDPEHYLLFAFFDDYDSAMRNSNLPETGAFGEKQAALLDQPPTFIDLDVLEDQS